MYISRSETDFFRKGTSKEEPKSVDLVSGSLLRAAMSREGAEGPESGHESKALAFNPRMWQRVRIAAVKPDTTLPEGK
jgi:hypothetical protein